MLRGTSLLAGLLRVHERRGETQLVVAAQNVMSKHKEQAKVSVARAQILAGADVNLGRPDDGSTALTFAAESGHAKLCQLLLEADADTKACDGDGRTVLFSAVCNADCSTQAVLDVASAYIVQLLLRAGANCDAVDTAGNRALDYAKHNQLVQATALLQRARHAAEQRRYLRKQRLQRQQQLEAERQVAICVENLVRGVVRLACRSAGTHNRCSSVCRGRQRACASRPTQQTRGNSSRICSPLVVFQVLSR